MTYLSLPGTKSEHGNQSLLLAPANLKTPNDADGKEQNDHILPNVQPCRTKPDNVFIHAAPVFHRLVPEEIDGIAQKDITKNAPGATCTYYAQHSIACTAKVPWREDADVLNKDGDFGHCEREVVDPEAGPEHLYFESVLSPTPQCPLERTKSTEAIQSLCL